MTGHRSRRAWIVAALIASTAACSGSHGVVADAGAGAGLEAGADAGTDASTPPVLRLTECEGQPECAVVVRLDYTTLARLAWRAVGGPYEWASDSDMARRTVELVALTGVGPPSAQAFVEPPVVRAHVAAFFVPATDFGGMAIFHATTGQLLFAGTTVWAGRGDIITPPEWRKATDLVPQPHAAGGAALGRGEMGVLTDAEAAAIASPARDTNLGAALVAWNGPGQIAAHLFLYARSTGGLDPRTAEWVVVLTPERPSRPSLPAGTTCNPDYCGGCCDHGTCRRGDEPAACGALGVACLACSATWWCAWQTEPASCQSLPP